MPIVQQMVDSFYLMHSLSSSSSCSTTSGVHPLDIEFAVIKGHLDKMFNRFLFLGSGVLGYIINHGFLIE